MANDKNKKDEPPNFTWAGLFILLISVVYFVFILPILMQ